MTDLICIQLPISSNIEQATSSIVRAGTKSVSIREELNSVDIRLMTAESLHGLPRSDIPELSKSVASTGDKDVVICGIDADGHDVAQMVGKLGNFTTSFDIPQHAGHIARRSDDATVIDEAAAGEIAGMATELPCDTGGAFSGVEVVD